MKSGTKIGSIEYTTIKTFKAKVTASKPHYVQKVVSSRLYVPDAFKGHFQSSITIFMPKLKPNQPRPCVLMAVKNGGGSVLLRTKSPKALADILRKTADILDSDLWYDTWIELENLSSKIICGECILDSDFMDKADFEREFAESEKDSAICQEVKVKK